ncbi:MAG: fused MFS/spermidine synthase [Kiritimatiellia bacterium]
MAKSTDRNVALATPALLLAGAGVMLLELMAARAIAPVFGHSVATWAAITGAILSGVMLGNAAGGRLSDLRKSDPALWAVVGLAAGAFLSWRIPALARALGGWAAARWGYLPALTFTAVALYVPPTFVLGWVSPSIAAAAVRAGHTGRDLGSLYAASMAGYCLGSVAGGLVLPLSMGVVATHSLVAGLLVLGAVAAWAWRRGARAPAGQEAVADVPAPAAGRASLPRLPLALAALAGALGMVVELAGARLASPVVGGSHLTWGALYATFILFMGAGGLLGGRIADRFGAARTACGALAACGAATLAELFISVSLARWTTPMGWPFAVRLPLHAALPFVPMALASGAAGTALAALVNERAIREGRRSGIGYCYAVNGAGSAAGSFLGGYFLVGRIPTPTLLGASAALFGIGAWLLADDGSKAPWQKTARRIVAGLAVVGAVLWFACDAGAGVRPAAAAEYGPILADRETRYNRVMVVEGKEHPLWRSLFLDRIPHTAVDLRDPNRLFAPYTRMLAACVEARADTLAAAEPARRPDVFMIGGGGYALPRRWRESRLCQSLVVAEIDPVVQAFAEQYLDAEPGEGEIRFAEDGRRVLDRLARDREVFDIVIGDTVSDMAVPYHLTTREFLERVRAVLRPGGLYLMHVLDVQDSPGFLGSMFRTVEAVFPEARILGYAPQPDTRTSFILVCSDAPMETAAIEARLAAEWSDFEGGFLPEAGHEALRTADAVVYTDDFAPVERHVLRTAEHLAVSRRANELGKRADALWKAGDRALALDHARRALALWPEVPPALQLVDRAMSTGAFPPDEGLALLRKAALRKTGDRIRLGLLYVQAAHREGRGAEAQDVLASLAKAFPRNPDVQRWQELRMNPSPDSNVSSDE